MASITVGQVLKSGSAAKQTHQAKKVSRKAHKAECARIGQITPAVRAQYTEIAAMIEENGGSSRWVRAFLAGGLPVLQMVKKGRKPALTGLRKAA